MTDLKLSLPLPVLVPMAFQTLQSKPLHLPLFFDVISLNLALVSVYPGHLRLQFSHLMYSFTLQANVIYKTDESNFFKVEHPRSHLMPTEL